MLTNKDRKNLKRKRLRYRERRIEKIEIKIEWRTYRKRQTITK